MVWTRTDAHEPLIGTRVVSEVVGRKVKAQRWATMGAGGEEQHAARGWLRVPRECLKPGVDQRKTDYAKVRGEDRCGQGAACG